MKKRKTFGLFGTNKRKTAKRADKRIDTYDEELYEDEYDEEEYALEDEEGAYYEDGEYGDAEEYAEEYEEDYEDNYIEEAQESVAEDAAEYAEEYDTEDYDFSESEYDETDYIEGDSQSAYAEDDDYYEEEYYEDDEEWDDEAYDTQYDGGAVHTALPAHKRQSLSWETVLEAIRGFIRQMTPFDAIIVCTGLVLLVAAIVAGSMVLASKNIEDEIAAIVPVGTELSSVGVVGESGLLAMADARINAVSSSTEELEDVVYSTESEDEEVTKVSVSFESVERDLKIRFTDASSGSLITGTAFEVVLTNSKGKQTILVDDDKDGIIYEGSMSAGKYDAVITSTDKYKFPSASQQITVKDKVEYVVINVQDEVKSEAQVNVAAEDTQKADAAAEEVKLTDTVEYVESTKTLLSGTESYLPVDKSTIQDPSASSRLGRSLYLFDGISVTLDKGSAELYTGSSLTLSGTSFSDSTEEKDNVTTKLTYSAEWKSSDTGVASVDAGGKVTANKAGTVTITYTVTRKTTTTTKTQQEPIKEETKEEISVESYNALSEEEQQKCTEIRNEAGELTGYTYTKTTTKEQEPKVETTETTDTASATCTVTVKDVAISSATLEITRSADACSVGQTLTVKPSKLVYTKNDGSTETRTDSFPTVSWSSSDKAIATVDANGTVTGVKAGKVTITGQISGIKGQDGKELTIKASTDVTINAAQNLTVKLDQTQAKLTVGKTLTLKATVTNYKSDQGITWTSSDTKLATVDSTGVVTAVAAGSVKITATTIEKDADTGKTVSAECTITVEKSSAASDTTTKLKDKNGNQIYVKNSDGTYREAVYADYFTASEFYLKTEGQYAYTGWQTINGKTYFYDKNGKVVTGAQIIQGVTYNFGSDGAIQTTVNGSKFGIDVSRHNGTIDWNAVKSSGVDYVIIRCGYRGSSSGALITDQNFKSNIKGATAAGLKVGIYVFSQAINEVEAVKEASLAVSLAKGYNLTYPIFIDTESSGGRADKIDVATRTAVVNAFCQTVQSAGYQAGIYASKSWYETKLSMSAIGSYKIWLAQYAAAPTYGGRYDMWQYSSKGTISGINGKVDLNLSYLGY